jgi:N utilization substance protein B
MSEARHAARALALQGLYEVLLAGHDPEDIRRGVLNGLARAEPWTGPEREGYETASACGPEPDRAYFEALWSGLLRERAALETEIAPFLDRPLERVSPVEHALLLIGAFELAHRPDIPYRVVIDEAVELARSFGGTDGHRYVNGVLDRLAGQLRPAEQAAHRGVVAKGGG